MKNYIFTFLASLLFSLFLTIAVSRPASAQGIYCSQTCQTCSANCGNIPPVCDAGGPYTGIECSTEPLNVRLEASRSFDFFGSRLSYSWATDCPKGSFDDNSSVRPLMSVITAPNGANKTPINCKVYLVVSNKSGMSSFCSAAVTSQSCIKDCLGVVNGTAKVDRCGVCNGNGQACLGCESVDIKGQQLVIDQNANEMRDLVLKINRQINIASKNAQLSKKEIGAENRYIDSSSAAAQSAYNSVWQNTYVGVPSVVVSCTSALCVNTSTASFKINLKEGNQDLVSLANASYLNIKAVQKKALRNHAKNLNKVNRAVKSAKEYLDLAKRLDKQSVSELGKIPSTHSSC